VTQRKKENVFAYFFAGEAAAAVDGKNDFDQKVMKMKNIRKDRMTSLREMSEDICPYGVQHNFYASKSDDNRINAESKARGRKLFLRKNYQLSIYNNFVINIVTDSCPLTYFNPR
jgi:hypothetical protein